jgi:hypothetical protein
MTSAMSIQFQKAKTMLPLSLADGFILRVAAPLSSAPKEEGGTAVRPTPAAGAVNAKLFA